MASAHGRFQWLKRVPLLVLGRVANNQKVQTTVQRPQTGSLGAVRLSYGLIDDGLKDTRCRVRHSFIEEATDHIYLGKKVTLAEVIFVLATIGSEPML